MSVTNHTYQPINTQADLQQAINDLYGEDAQWVHRYFASGQLESGDVSDRQDAFKAGMDELFAALLRDGDTTTRMAQLAPGRLPNNLYTYAQFIGDGRFNVGEFRQMLEMFDTQQLNLRQRLGEEEYIKFEQLAIGLLNGIADRDGAAQFTRDELGEIFSADFIHSVYRPVMEENFPNLPRMMRQVGEARETLVLEQAIAESIKIMDSYCSSIPQQSLEDALPISAPSANSRGGYAR